MNIYAGNLPYTVSENELRDLFAEFGEVSEVHLITDRYSGRSKGFGFVEMPQESEAQTAIDNLNERNVKGRNLKVNKARPRQ